MLADNFTIFVIARAVGGISKANVSLATAVMADVTDAATRSKAMVTFLQFKNLSCDASAMIKLAIFCLFFF